MYAPFRLAISYFRVRNLIKFNSTTFMALYSSHSFWWFRNTKKSLSLQEVSFLFMHNVCKKKKTLFLVIISKRKIVNKYTYLYIHCCIVAWDTYKRKTHRFEKKSCCKETPTLVLYWFFFIIWRWYTYDNMYQMFL